MSAPATPVALVDMTWTQLHLHAITLAAALEAEQQWRMQSAATLLAAETRAYQAETEVTRLREKLSEAGR